MSAFALRYHLDTNTTSYNGQNDYASLYYDVLLTITLTMSSADIPSHPLPCDVVQQTSVQVSVGQGAESGRTEIYKQSHTRDLVSTCI